MTSRHKKHLIVILSIMLVIIVAAIVFPRLVNLNRYRVEIESELESVLGGDVTLGEISWGISTGIWLELDRFTVRDATVAPIDADRFTFRRGDNARTHLG